MGKPWRAEKNRTYVLAAGQLARLQRWIKNYEATVHRGSLKPFRRDICSVCGNAFQIGELVYRGSRRWFHYDCWLSTLQGAD